MDELPGALGTSASLALRFGQAVFSIASLLFMCFDVQFYSYTAFWKLLIYRRFGLGSSLLLPFLVTIMGLVIPWSLTLALVDAYAVFFKRPSRQPGVMAVIVIGDWLLTFLSLAAACATASVTDILRTSSSFCGVKLCTRYQLAAAMTFLSWFLSLASSLFNLWLLPSL